jgi:hypothetical protein
MPTFRGLVNEEGVLELIEYLKSRGASKEAEPSAAPVSSAPTNGPAREPAP